MKNTLIIGAGGVGNVVTQKCAQHNDELGDICLASRTLAKCERILQRAHELGNVADPRGRLYPAQIDARDARAVAKLIRDTRAGIVINVAPPYCNLGIIEACLDTGAHYIDTALYEPEDAVNAIPPWYANHEWKLRPRFAERGITGVLGMGFDPGAVNAFCAYVHRHLIDTIDSIDIMDVNAGDHGQFFATNFDPEVNLREVAEDAIYRENGEWVTVPCHSKSRVYDFPGLGEQRVYSMGHDEIHSLAMNIPARRIEFWMGFSDHYIQCFNVLKRIGLLSIEPVKVGDVEIAPIKMVKAVLPEPASLAPGYTGNTCIGCLIKGTREGKPRQVFIYNTCDHQACYREVGSQAISYTTGVPAVTAALLIRRGVWNVKKLVNVEELDPEPFMKLMPELGLSWELRE